MNGRHASPATGKQVTLQNYPLEEDVMAVLDEGPGDST